LAEAAEVARRAASDVHLVAMVERLDFLAKSGRLPGLAAWAGNSLVCGPCSSSEAVGRVRGGLR
jgi:fatty acid-binding protein DegV